MYESIDGPFRSWFTEIYAEVSVNKRMRMNEGALSWSILIADMKPRRRKKHLY